MKNNIIPYNEIRTYRPDMVSARNGVFPNNIPPTTEKIIYISDELDPGTTYSIFLINPDGTGKQDISNHSNAWSDLFGAISPSGDKILITTNESGNNHLTLCDVSLSQGIYNRNIQVSATAAPAGVLFPCFISNDNKHVVFAQKTSTSTATSLKHYNVQTQTLTDLIADISPWTDISDVYLNFNNDKIILSVLQSTVRFLVMYDIEFNTPSISNQVVLSIDASIDLGTNPDLVEMSLNYAEDKMILVIAPDPPSNLSTTANIYLYDFSYTGTNLTNGTLLQSTGLNRYPSFDHTFTKYCFSSNRDGDYEIFKRDSLTAGAVDQLTSNTILDFTGQQVAWTNIAN